MRLALTTHSAHVEQWWEETVILMNETPDCDYEEHLNDYPFVMACASDDGSQFEWGGFLKRLRVPHVLFRDIRHQQYTKGAIGIGDLVDTVNYIKHVKLKYRHTIAIGLSSGGYGALYLGALAYVNKVICMSPVTGLYIKDEFDPKWHHRLEPRLGPDSPCIVDLKPMYVRKPKPIVKAFIGNGYGTELDRQMVERIGVTDITELDGVAHADVARVVRDNGMLEREIFA